MTCFVYDVLEDIRLGEKDEDFLTKLDIDYSDNGGAKVFVSFYTQVNPIRQVHPEYTTASTVDFILSCL
jgi:hypothetical protein